MTYHIKAYWILDGLDVVQLCSAFLMVIHKLQYLGYGKPTVKLYRK
jgi:hypothetical protein